MASPRSMTGGPGARGAVVAGGLLLILATTTRGVAAQVLGAQFSVAKDAAVLLWGDGGDTQLGVGMRLELSLASLSLPGPLAASRAVGSFDYFFPDCDALRGGATRCSYWELNANVATPLGSGSLNPYLGAGVSLAGSSSTVPPDPGGPASATRSSSFTEIGVNLLGGVRYALGGVSLYTEARVEAGGGEQFVLSTGVLFGS